ncbi:hypothetical protein ACWD62_31445 [Streptomyces sp. NPDC005146]
MISRHAKSLGYDGIILFLDELILWLQAHMSNREKVNSEVSKLVKLIESGDSARPVPIVSLISRQRDLSHLVGADVVGADVKNLEQQVEYLAGRFDVIGLEDRNLPEIIKERILKPKDQLARAALDDAFATIESSNSQVKDVLLDAHGATHADWSDFRAVYPLSPALLNVLVALSGALQRERTGLKLLQEMLRRRRADIKLGELIPLGDLWDVLSDGTGEAFTDRLKNEAEAAHTFHAKVRAHLLEKYGSEQSEKFIADDRFVKTLLLAALAPDVPALKRLTGGRIAALSHGSIRSRTVASGSLVVTRLRELQAEFGEIRADGDQDPVFTLHLSDLDIEPLLDMVADEDRTGSRRIWVKDQLWKTLGLKDSGAFVCEHEIVWQGTKRTAEFVFENVRDTAQLSADQFRPGVDGRVRFILDYPFDDGQHYPNDDAQRVEALRSEGLMAPTLVWLPSFFSEQKSAQLGRLIKINYLLERDRLDDYAGHLHSDDRVRVRHQLAAQRDTLTSQLTATLAQLYGIAKVDENSVSAEVSERDCASTGTGSASHDTSDAVLATALTSAPDVLQALDDADWALLDGVRGFAGRQDSVGERAERLIAEIAETAATSEFERSLIPVLGSIRAKAVVLVQDAARLTQVETPVAPQPVVVPEPPAADDVSLTQHGRPSVPSSGPAASTAPGQPSTGLSRTVRLQPSHVENSLNKAIDNLWDEILAYAAAHPGMAVEITWQVVPAEDGTNTSTEDEAQS